MKHIVALSGGKDSTAMALALKEIEPERDYQFVCTPTKNELPEMKAHWRKLGHILGSELIELPTVSLASLVYKFKAVPNHQMRWCTRLIKILPFELYALENLPCTIYVGIRADEGAREGVAYEELAPLFVNRRYPLCDWGWGITDVFTFLERRDIIIPKRTDCALCFYQTLYEWYELYQQHPDIWAQGEAWEAFTSHTLRSEQRDSWPASMNGLRQEFERGRIPSIRKKKERPVMCSVCAR